MTSLEIVLPRSNVAFADEKAALFFLTDASSAGADSYDEWVGSPQNPPNRLMAEDLRAVNRTMRGRSATKHWPELALDGDLAWLSAIPTTWSLLEIDDDGWKLERCEQRLTTALSALNGPYRRAAVVTKMLHIKRPAFIPICDSYVATVMGLPAWDAESTVSLVLAIRDVGRRNLGVLRTIDTRLRSIGIERSLVRILDALLWFDAPSQGMPGAYARFEGWLVGHKGGHLFFE